MWERASERGVFEFLSSWSVRTGKLFTSIFTNSSPAGTFLSDSKLLPNTEENKWEKLLCYDYLGFVVMIGPCIYWAQWATCQEKQKWDNSLVNIHLHFLIETFVPMFSWLHGLACFAISKIIGTGFWQRSLIFLFRNLKFIQISALSVRHLHLVTVSSSWNLLFVTLWAHTCLFSNLPLVRTKKIVFWGDFFVKVSHPSQTKYLWPLSYLLAFVNTYKNKSSPMQNLTSLLKALTQNLKGLPCFFPLSLYLALSYHILFNYTQTVLLTCILSNKLVKRKL